MSEIKLILKGLTCPNCSAKIERAVNELDGVSKAVYNIINQEMTLQTDIAENELVEIIDKVVKKYEDGVEVLKKSEAAILEHGACTCHDEHCHHHAHEHCCEHDHAHSHAHAHDEDNAHKIIAKSVVRLFIGGAFFAAGFAGLGGSCSFLFYLAAYLVFGYDVILKAVKNLLHGSLFDENFLMSIATVGAFIIGEYTEAVAVMLFYQIGEFFQDMAVDSSTRSIKELMDLMPEFANLVDENGEIKRVSPEAVKAGDSIVIKNGEKIPLDCVITKGESYLDTSALTGESKKASVSAGSRALSGCLNEGGVLYATVEKSYENTTVKKIMDMVENAAANKSKTESFITEFARIYTPIVCSLALALFVIPTAMGFPPKIWLYRALVFLVSSCPCALVLSIPLTFFSGLGAASRKGVLVKGSDHLQALAEINTVVMDKTGTLTKGVFKVTKVSDEKAAEYCAALEKYSNHPIAAAVLDYKSSCPDATEVKELRGLGLKGIIDGKAVLAGNMQLMEKYGISCNRCDDIGTVIYVACDNSFVGTVTVSDEIKEDSKKAVKIFGENNIETVMLTGDREETARKSAAELGIKTYFAELLPQDKVTKLEEMYASGNKKIAFIGDGINDAPVLARADVGAAMGGIGSDAAIEAADAVIMNDDVSKLYDAIKTAKNTLKLARQNVAFVIAVKVVVLVLAALGFANMWLAVFADVGVALLAILNSLRRK